MPMPRLFLKLFGTFWLTTVLILSISIFASFRLADEGDALALIDPREADALLRDVLAGGGVAGLRDWLADSRNFPPGQTIYVVDEGGNELLYRRIPPPLERRLDRIWAAVDRHAGRHDDIEPTRRRHRFMPVLEAPDGTRLLAVPGPALLPRFGALSGGGRGWIILSVAAVTSLLSFWLLSRSLSRPARRISDAVTRFASGDFSARVGREAYSRDEVGEIARQFDRMAAELEAQSRSRQELFRNVSHELRAPLARLSIAVELLERKPGDAPGRLARIREEIDVLDRLTGQVLSLTRATQGGGGDDLVPLARVLERVVDNARLEADARGVELDCEMPGASVRLRADETLLASAIENVLRNAVQSAPDGGRVAVTTAASAGRVRIAVSDSGSGVPEAELERIFEPFYRLDTNRPGSGIGLAITARVVEQLGGRVRAANRPAGGLEVTLELPLAATRPAG